MGLARDLCHSTSAQPLCSSSFCFAKFLFQWFFFFSVRIWGRKITFRKKAPSTRIIRFCWETEGFLTGLAYRSHVFDENGHQKRIISKTVSRVKIFENAGHSLTCGGTKTEVSEYDDVIHHLPLAKRMLYEGYYRTFVVYRFRVDGGKRFEYVTCGGVFFGKRRKKSSFSKISRYVWREPKTPEPVSVCMQICEKLIHNRYTKSKRSRKSPVLHGTLPTWKFQE